MNTGPLTCALRTAWNSGCTWPEEVFISIAFQTKEFHDFLEIAPDLLPGVLRVVPQEIRWVEGRHDRDLQVTLFP